MDTVVVAHPETGQPSVAETHYRVLELTTETDRLNELEAQLAEATETELEATNSRTALESAVADQKSLVQGIEAITPTDGGVDTGTDGTSGDPSNDVAGSSTTDESDPTVI